jgi:ABC-type molybdate transport system substrate-binding protein
MKAFKIILASLVFAQVAFAGQGPAVSGQVRKFQGATTLSDYSQMVGPGSTGGGEPVSQEVRAIVSSLPGILRSQGLQYFPEVDINELEKKTQGGVLVELVPPDQQILVDGSPKASKFDRDRNLIQVDPIIWATLRLMPDAEVRKRAIVFHEVLGLMGLEKNNDYTISNRLVSAEFLSALGIKGTSDQILPMDAGDKQVIFWRVSNEGRISFFYCQDRTMVSSCIGLGARSYTNQDLDLKYREVYAQIEKAHYNKNVALGVTASVITGVIAAGFIFTTGGIIVVVGLIVALPLGGTWINDSYREIDKAEYKALTTKQASYLKAGTAPAKNFREFAEGLNQFLISIDSSVDLTPEAPAVLVQKLN